MSSPGYLTVYSPADIDAFRQTISARTTNAIDAVIKASSSPLEAMRRMKFEQVGFHPIEDRPLNIIEQINQTFTYLVALSAEWLLVRHPEAKGFKLAPGASMALELDIMSVEPGLVGAGDVCLYES